MHRYWNTILSVSCRVIVILLLLCCYMYFSVPYYVMTKAAISVYSSHMILVAHIKIHPQKTLEAICTFLTDCLLWAWFWGKETLGKIKLRNTGMSKESGCFEKCKKVTSGCWGVLNKLECAGLCLVSLISTPDCQRLCLFHWIKSMGQHCIVFLTLLRLYCKSFLTEDRVTCIYTC